jgi:hypothetical protein
LYSQRGACQYTEIETVQTGILMTPTNTSLSFSPRAALWRPLGALLLLALVLAGYYVYHKPLPPESLVPVVGTALDLLAAGLVLAAGLAVGRALLSALAARLALDVSRVGRAGQLSLSGLLGLAILSAAALGLGLAGLYHPFAFWLVLAANLVVFRRGLRACRDDGWALLPHARPRSRFGWLLLALVVFQLALALAVALAPPSAWDAMTYHLVAPQRDLAAGRMLGYDDNFYLGLPKLAETLYGVGMGLFGRDTAAAPLHFGFGLLGLLAIMGLTRRLTSRADGAWLAAALLLGGYNSWLLFATPYVDLAVLAYAAGAFVCALAWESDRKAGWVLLAGLLAGSAIGVKYTGATVGLAIGLFVLIRARGAAIRPLLALLAGAVTACTPWALRGLLLYSNPVYPYVFGGLGWEAARTAAANQAGRGLLSLGLGWQIPVLPFAATIFGGDFEGTYFYTAGPWLLTAPFLLVFTWPYLSALQRKTSRNAALLLAPMLVVWAVVAATSAVGMQTRLSIAIFPLMAMLAALGIGSLDALPKKPVQVGFIARALIGVTLIFSAAEVLHAAVLQRPLAPILGVTSREAALTDSFGPLAEALAQLDTLAEDSTVRFLFEPRGYPCPAHLTCRGDALLDFWSAARRLGQSPEAIFAGWAAQGDDYVLMFDAGYALWTSSGATYAPAEDAELPAALGLLGAPVWRSSDGLYTVYRLPGEGNRVD